MADLTVDSLARLLGRLGGQLGRRLDGRTELIGWSVGWKVAQLGWMDKLFVANSLGRSVGVSVGLPLQVGETV